MRFFTLTKKFEEDSQMNEQHIDSKNPILMNKVLCPDGFNPDVFAVDFTDKEDSSKTKPGLTVNGKLAWFRLINPDGRISQVKEFADEKWTVTARVYKDRKDEDTHFLAEASATRGSDEKYPPLESAQSSAISIALRNAGYILPSSLQERTTPDEIDLTPCQDLEEMPPDAPPAMPQSIPPTAKPQASEPTATSTSKSSVTSMTLEDAYATICPLSQYKGKTLGELVGISPETVSYLARSGRIPEVKNAASMVIADAQAQAEGA